MSRAATTSRLTCGAEPLGRPYWLPLGLTVLIVASIYAFSPNFRNVGGPDASPYAGDFLQEWIGGYMVRAGDHHRLYDLAYARALQHDTDLVGFQFNEREYFPVVYPPFYYLVISPLSHLPMRTAAWVWGVFLTGCFAATAVLLGRGLLFGAGHPTGIAPSLQPVDIGTDTQGSHGRLAAVLPWTLPLAVLFVPLLESLSSSQKGTLCLLILTGTFLLLRRNRPLAAGMVFGLLAFKPQLTLVIAVAMLLKRQWRFVLGGILTGVVLVGLSLAVGWDACRAYARFATATADYVQNAGYDVHKSHCLYGFFTLLFGLPPTPATKVATLLAGCGVIYLLARTLRGPLAPGSPRFVAQFSSLIVATVLLSPHLFTYDLTVLLLPMVLLAAQWSASRPGPDKPGEWIIWLLALLYVLPGISVTVAASIGLQMTVPLMAAVLLALGSGDRRPKTED